jgi:hypothetical protein
MKGEANRAVAPESEGGFPFNILRLALWGPRLRKASFEQQNFALTLEI